MYVLLEPGPYRVVTHLHPLYIGPETNTVKCFNVVNNNDNNNNNK